MTGVHPVLVAELRDARLKADRLRLDVAERDERIAQLEQQIDAQQDFIALLARNGEGARL